MPVARNVVPLVATVGVVMALAASTATAATVRTEGGAVCSAISENDAPATPEVTGGCAYRGTATDFEWGGAFGVMATCDMNVEGRINLAGNTTNVWTINAATGGCESNTATPCAGAADAHWSTSAIGGGASPYTATASFCVVAFGFTTRCIGVAFTWTEGAAHTYSMNYNHANKGANGVCSLQGTTTQVIDAAHPKIEIS